jgi:hypothetical protein
MEYGIYSFARAGTGVPKIHLMTMNGDWTQSVEAAGRWGSREMVEAALKKASEPEGSRNIWWFTWSDAEVPHESEEK